MKQNVFKKVLPYKMRNAAMALAATVAGMTTTSCEKEDDILPDEPKKEIEKKPVVKKNKYYNMYIDYSEATDSIPAHDVFNIDFMCEELAKEDTDTMFVVPRGNVWQHQRYAIMSYVAEYMRRLEEIGGDRILGAGQIRFKSGEPSKAPRDSAYLCSRGILINPVKTR